MSLSPFVSFQSRFVTYLLTYPRVWLIKMGRKKILFIVQFGCDKLNTQACR